MDKMSLKSKLMNIMTSHPKLSIMGMGLAITFVIGMTITMLDNQALAHVPMCKPYPPKCW